jgi:hypothetical protein
MVHNWKTVALDQFQTLHQCGLGHAARHMLFPTASMSVLTRRRTKAKTPKLSDLLDLMAPYQFPVQIVQTVQADRAPWDGLIMKAV